jgi:hypothetical protein
MQLYTREQSNQAPIFPDASAGYIILREQYDDLLRNLGYPDEDKIVMPAIARIPYSPLRRIRYGSVLFMLNKGLYIYQIAATRGYTGKTEDGIGLGSTLADVQRIWGPGQMTTDDTRANLWIPKKYSWTMLKISLGNEEVPMVSVIIIADLAKNNFEFEDHFPQGILETKKRMIIKHPVEKPLEY